MIDGGTDDLVYASHVLEHFGRHQVAKPMLEWYRVLKTEGTLRLAVPDFEKIEQKDKEKKIIKTVGMLEVVESMMEVGVFGLASIIQMVLNWVS